MSTTLQADNKGALHLPASVLPSPEPLGKYRIEQDSGKLIISKEPPDENDTKPFWKYATGQQRVAALRAWLQEAATPTGLSDHAVSRDSIYD